MRHIGEEFGLVPVGGLNLPALFFDLTKQTSVLNGQGLLGRESLKKIDQLRIEGSGTFLPNRQRTH